MAIFEGELAESLSSDDSIPVLWNVQAILAESLSSDDSELVLWEIQGAVAESLSSDDTPLIGWNAQCLIADSIVAETIFDPKHSNPYGRYKYSLNLQGNSLQLKIQHNTAGQSIFLHDIGVHLYAHQVRKQNQHSMNIQNQHIQLKIQNNTVDEKMHLFDYGVGVYKKEGR